MNNYTTPKVAIYLYKQPNYDGTFKVQHVKCDVLGENELTYVISPYVPLNGRKARCRMTVRKHNVRFYSNATTTMTATMPDYTDAWWNN